MHVCILPNSYHDRFNTPSPILKADILEQNKVRTIYFPFNALLVGCLRSVSPWKGECTSQNDFFAI